MMDEVNALKNRGFWRVVKVRRSAADQIEVCLSCQEELGRPSYQAKFETRGAREGIDYDETFASVAKVTTFRLMLALSKVLNLQIHQLDVDSAFLYADLDEDVYVTPPRGFVFNPVTV